MITLLLSKGEGVLDDVARLTELPDVFAVDVDFNAAGIADAHHRVLPVKRLGRARGKRTLHANIAVNGDPKPRGGGKHESESVCAPARTSPRVGPEVGRTKAATDDEGAALPLAALRANGVPRIVSSLYTTNAIKSTATVPAIQMRKRTSPCGRHVALGRLSLAVPGGRRRGGLRPVECGDRFFGIDSEEACVGTKEAANVDRRTNCLPILVFDCRQIDRPNADLLGNGGKRKVAGLACRAKPLTQGFCHLGFELALP